MKITQIPTPLLGGPSNGGSVSLKPALGNGPKGDTGNTGPKGDKGDKGDTGDVTPAAAAAKDAAETAASNASTSASNASSSATAATNAKTAAETARDQAVAVGNTNDTIISGRINDPASATRSALNDSFAQRKNPPKVEGSKNGIKYDGTDETTAMQALITACVTYGVGVIELEGLVRCDGQLTIPTTVVGTQRREAPLRITGTVTHMPGSALSTNAYPKAAGLDLRYAGRTDSGCTTTLGSVIINNPAAVASDRGNIVVGPGIPDQCWILGVTPGVGWSVSAPARATGTVSLTSFGGRLESHGYGTLELDHLQLISGGTTSAPFGLSTATTVRIHDNTFIGSKSAAACDEDPWVAGGPGQGTVLTSAVSGATTSLPVAAVPVDIPSGSQLILNYGTTSAVTVTTSAAVSSGATSIPVSSFTPGATIPTRSTVYIGGSQSQTHAESWNVASGLFQGYLSVIERNHFHGCRRIAVGGFTTDFHIEQNAWMHNCGSNLSAKPSTLTTALTAGTAYTTLAVSALDKPILTGDVVQIGVSSGQFTAQEVTVTADAAAGATSLSVASFTAVASFGTGTLVYNTTAGLGAMIASFAIAGSTNAVTIRGNRFGFSGGYSYATRSAGPTLNAVIEANNNQDVHQSGYTIATHRFDRNAAYNLVVPGLIQTAPAIDDRSRSDGVVTQTVHGHDQGKPTRLPQGFSAVGLGSEFLPTPGSTAVYSPSYALSPTNAWAVRAEASDYYLTHTFGGVTADVMRLQDSPAGVNVSQYWTATNEARFYNLNGHMRYQVKAGYKVYLGDVTYPSVTYVDKGAVHTAAVAVSAVATGSRPAASLHGAGAMIFDTTLNKPIWSTGSAWVDATGATV